MTIHPLETPPRGPFDSTQFLLTRSRSSRRQIENDEGEAVLMTAGPRRSPRRGRAAVALIGLAAVGYFVWPALKAGGWVVGLVALPLIVRLRLALRRTAAFYDAITRERLMELRPEAGRWRARHCLLDGEGRLIARFELALLRARWLARDESGRVIAVGAMRPRIAAWTWLGRGGPLRFIALSTPGAPPLGRIERRSPDFDEHDLLDLSGDPETLLDRRVAVALAVLIG